MSFDTLLNSECQIRRFNGTDKYGEPQYVLDRTVIRCRFATTAGEVLRAGEGDDVTIDGAFYFRGNIVVNEKDEILLLGQGLGQGSLGSEPLGGSSAGPPAPGLGMTGLGGDALGQGDRAADIINKIFRIVTLDVVRGYSAIHHTKARVRRKAEEEATA